MKRMLLVAAVSYVCTAVPSFADYVNCEAYAAQASQRHGLPDGLLRAIARTESGRSLGKDGLRAWPWTSNIKGKGFYYASKEEALAHLIPLVQKGVTSFDVGCMQLNFRWHGDNFDSLSDMIDPAKNTDYAARYLRELRAETGAWDGATRYYHSRTPARGRAYLGRVKKALARLKTADTTVAMAQITAETPRSVKPAPKPAAKMASVRSGALVTVAMPKVYWDNPALEPGAFPDMR